jgi:hypothetical protein
MQIASLTFGEKQPPKPLASTTALSAFVARDMTLAACRFDFALTLHLTTV